MPKTEGKVTWDEISPRKKAGPVKPMFNAWHGNPKEEKKDPYGLTANRGDDMRRSHQVVSRSNALAKQGEAGPSDAYGSSV